MTFFESLIALLVVAIALIQVSRRLGLPYPAMLAVAGVVVALVPAAPTIVLDPGTALALFIAPALLDAAYDFPAGAARQMWRPLVVLAFGAVIVTAGVVALIGWAYAGLPIAAALALGAIVAPPDAAAATAVLGSMPVPRSTAGIIKGESLFNDATALVLFSEAVYVQGHGGLDWTSGLGIALGVPGGILLGVVAAWISARISPLIAGTLGGNLLQFANTFGLWLIAEHLHLSAVLAVVTFAMLLARRAGGGDRPRDRVHSFAVWSSVVFLLNILAFLLMGMQARVIFERMSAARLEHSFVFVLLVAVAVVVVRMVITVGYTALSSRFRRLRGDLEPASLRQAVLTGWSGMRGLLTLATAFALPQDFPQRDVLVLAAFGVVLVTLVVQGLTLSPLIGWLGLDDRRAFKTELVAARRELVTAGLATLTGRDGPAAEAIRYRYMADYQATGDPPDKGRLEGLRDLGLAAIRAERRRLDALLGEHRIGSDGYLKLQEELDWRELAQLPPGDRRIEET